MFFAGSGDGLGVGEDQEEGGPCSHPQGAGSATQQCALACSSVPGPLKLRLYP